MNNALLDTDIYSEVLKAIDQTVTRNATAYRQAQGRLTFSVITVMEIIQGLQKVGASPKRIQAFRQSGRLLADTGLRITQAHGQQCSLTIGSAATCSRWKPG